ncbi:MAG TPA: hypothetical protein VG984_01885 [Candidatus Paceibacterota bacterium]|nr:hypothetical protein [Candidatus Paceibacterota bacterium]
MDLDVEEVRELVKKNLELTEENHRILRGMRSAARWGRLITIVWWIVVVAVSGATYYYYVQPYVEQAKQVYADFEKNGQSAKNFGAEFAQFLEQFKKPQ